MHLRTDPSLAEVPGFTREQLDALARSVEVRRQQLEDGIEAYIRRRQEELRSYEQELLAHHRSMVSAQPTDKESGAGGGQAEARKHELEEKAKRTKHTRVQKREIELYGLVTPVFLPLLDAREPKPKPRHQRPDDNDDAPAPARPEHATPTRDAGRVKENRKPRSEDADMEGGGAAVAPATEPAHVDPPKKPKRTAKKSALRQNNSSSSSNSNSNSSMFRPRRKRVSLVIDGQTVLPADTVVEPALTSPSSEVTSPSTSTASLDDLIDPRLTAADPRLCHTEHNDAVHHSLPLPMSNNIHSPSKPLIETPNSITSESTTYRSPSTPALFTYNPPSVANSSFLDPLSAHPASLPATAGPDPIFADDSALNEAESADVESSFHTYVGGLHGSGTDDVDQAGSYGYPSSLGASYLESYMQSRPLRVRMEAADKAGLDEREKKVMMSAGNREKQASEDDGMDIDDEGHGIGNKEDAERDEAMDIMGEMEGF